jgi:hypothetical protein
MFYIPDQLTIRELMDLDFPEEYAILTHNQCIGWRWPTIII